MTLAVENDSLKDSLLIAVNGDRNSDVQSGNERDEKRLFEIR